MNRKRVKRVKGGGTLIVFSLAVAFVTHAHIIRLRHSHSHALHSIMVERKGERVRCTTSFLFFSCVCAFLWKTNCIILFTDCLREQQLYTNVHEIRVRIATSLHEGTSLYVLSTDLFLSSFVGNPKVL
jgi:hypothetical protein